MVKTWVDPYHPAHLWSPIWGGSSTRSPLIFWDTFPPYLRMLLILNSLNSFMDEIFMNELIVKCKVASYHYTVAMQWNCIEFYQL